MSAPVITGDEMFELLQKIRLIDNRQVDLLIRSQWLEAAHDAHWTFEEALAALRYHRAQSTEYLIPAHLTKIIRERRRQPADVSRLALGRGKPASAEHRARVLAQLRGQFGARVREV